MSTASKDAVQEQQGSSLYAAVARTATRSMALYFSRPVRLFRPPKVSGWHSLRGLAMQHGEPLTPRYMTALVKTHGFLVIPKHFVPPMLINVALGTVLWTTYTETSMSLEPYLGPRPTMLAAISGAVAGGVQALIAAPAENVRLVLEGGTSKGGWSHAWKEVIRGTQPPRSVLQQNTMREIRQVRDWMKEVGGMAGRGWDGWGWGCAKDVCGFAAFFSIFEITRHVALRTKTASQEIAHHITIGDDGGKFWQRHFPRTVHGIALVSGGIVAGLAYEFICRPFDVARKAVHLDSIAHALKDRSASLALTRKLQEEGLLFFFRDPSAVHDRTGPSLSATRRRLYSALRTLGRLGPWGVGFLVWEAFGPGLS